MNKLALNNKLINFQKKILSLTQDVESRERAVIEKELQNNLDLIAIIDSFENIFNSLDSKEKNTREESLNKSSRKAIKSFRAVYRKTTRILEDKGVVVIQFSDNIAQPGLCKIIETRTDPEKEEGSIIEIIKNGYQNGEKIIRPAEVITIANHE